jgi:AraC-like DNA-binding protein
MRGPLHDTVIASRINYYARLRRLASYINDHLSEPLDLEQAAQVACMEKTAFSRFFSKAVGITYHEFMQQHRISVAIEEMLRSDCSMTDVAFAVGFQNLNTFGRAFKKVTKLTPSEYKMQLLARHGITASKKTRGKGQNFAAGGQQVRSASAGS